MDKTKDSLGFFILKPVKAAIVSEISESTASAPVPPAEKVNFHIGNPIQDPRLSTMYLKATLGLSNTGVAEYTDSIFNELNCEGNEKDKLNFLDALIKRSAPYLPRGGYQKNNPTFLINTLSEWFEKKQQDSLQYNTGADTGEREIILSSGGIIESLRIFFHALSQYMVNTPVKIFISGFQPPRIFGNIASLQFEHCNSDETAMIKNLKAQFHNFPGQPVFLLAGKILSESSRRTLCDLSLSSPLFLVETNNAPNHLSFAREAKMKERVIRFLTPSVFHKDFSSLSIIFIAGNSEFLKIIETVHFQLKGSPSASEEMLLTFLLKDNYYSRKTAPEKTENQEESSINGGLNGGGPAEKNLAPALQRISKKIETVNNRINRIVNDAGTAGTLIKKTSESVISKFGLDEYCSLSAYELIDRIIQDISSKELPENLSASFLYSFVNHHPEYNLKDCSIVSGSSRTGLGLLGFHCGIEEVIIPDLSWTYEHCFPRVTAVPLSPELKLRNDLIIESVKEKIKSGSRWREYGAVALNNPHNATGQEFEPSAMKELVKWLLQNNIYIIDDLSYQNVAPSDEFKEMKTVKQAALKLFAEGHITKENLKRVITVHSVSKTDCLAGARLSVVEIMDAELKRKFDRVNSIISPNITAIFLTYLFYRRDELIVNNYWRLRNRIFKERMDAITGASENLPADRNPFGIYIKEPTGSMYPLMIIKGLPEGLSLEWLASGLSKQGIGLLPLSAFARTEEGYDTGRKTFRLTLGGQDDAATLASKTRRILIDINKMIAEESAGYIKKSFTVKPYIIKNQFEETGYYINWDNTEELIRKKFYRLINSYPPEFAAQGGKPDKEKLQTYFEERILLFKQRFSERLKIANELTDINRSGRGGALIETLEYEFYKDAISDRETRFAKRLYDRTVHPTQMYSLSAELCFDKIIKNVIRGESVSILIAEKAAGELYKEYFGLNVPVTSKEEPDELLLDIDSISAAEHFISIHSDLSFQSFISFWSDWDGSTRPSGQGHRLTASVIIENVSRLAAILKLILKYDKSVKIEAGLLKEIELLPYSNLRFKKLLDEITLLTHHLEKKYKGILPYNVKPGILRQAGIKLHLASDPLTSIWKHNDHLERKMLELREKRKESLDHYFLLNKQLRKILRSNLSSVKNNLAAKELLLEASLYKDLLKRFIITPRIHQKMITAQDQFAIDTTVYNINEINDISGRHGNPGMILGLQISMSTRPEPLIALDRKIHSVREEFQRESSVTLPHVKLIPLFEDYDSVKNINSYLNKIWEYSIQSRKINQETSGRFCEIIAEVFIAGSDLSQQISQAAGMETYKEARFETISWLAGKGLVGKVRMKMGSGEPMQRQGGYYSPPAGMRAFEINKSSENRLNNYLDKSTKRSTYYARTPLLGVFAGGDLRTFQSNISEKLRSLPVEEFARLLIHLKELQKFYQDELVSASEPMLDTRLQFETKGLKAIKRLTLGRTDEHFNSFVKTLTDNFREIIYGKENDVVGLHIISYFISKTTPPLRDRPTTRPGGENSGDPGKKIIEKIADTIPFSKHGSLLRAISHNQSQTSVAGYNQLTTGLFRALDSFCSYEKAGSDYTTLISERILPNLPVYEILETLRIYQDKEMKYINLIERAFPAGNSAFAAMREDADSINKYVPLFQKELLRRHGINPASFFEGNIFIKNLLPALRPDLAVLMQENIFNDSPGEFLKGISGEINEDWLKETEELLGKAAAIKMWRDKAWQMLSKPVFTKVKSFVELAIALNQLTAGKTKDIIFNPAKTKTASKISSILKGYSDDNIQQFIGAAMEYLSAASEGIIEVPTNIIKALKEAETIVDMERTALKSREQRLLQFYLLQIARLAGDNG